MSNQPAEEESSQTGKNDANMDKQTLLAVLQFLKKNNLKDTESLLKKEAKLTDEEVKKDEEQHNQTPSDVSQALAAYKSEGDPSLYEDYYTGLKQFVEKSLDVHKVELSMVLYPVFVHMYLELVYNNHEGQALRYFELFSGDQECYYEEDLRQLCTVSKAEHMAGNQLLDNFKSSKFTIRMSRDSYNHLKRYLLEKKQNLLLNIIQEHLFVDVFDGVPRTKQQIEAAAGGLCGEARRDANKGRVLYGLLKEPEITIQLDDDEETEAAAGKKKRPKKDPSLLKKAKNDPNAPQTSRVPLPELKDSDKLERARALREASKRVPLGPASLPSICFYTFLNAQQGVTSIETCEDCSMLSAGFADSSVRVWSVSPNRLRAVRPVDDLNLIDKEADDVLERMMDDRTATDQRSLLGHSGPVYSTAFSPDRHLMTSASEDGSIRLWSLQTWTNLVCYKGHIYPVWDVKFGPYGQYFVSGGHDRTARLWSTDHYQPVRIFAGHLADVESVQFHPNSNYIVTGSTDRTLRLWDVLSGNCVRIMTGHKAPINAIAFSPDGKYIVSAGADKMVLMWDVATGELVSQLKGHTDTIYTLAFSREGSLLASGGLDSVVKLWDMTKATDDQDTDATNTNVSSSPLEVASFPTKATPVLSLRFTRKNLLLAAGPYGS